eukprot:gene6428-biopygen2420
MRARDVPVHSRMVLSGLVPVEARETCSENKQEGTSQAVERVGCGCIRRNAVTWGGGYIRHLAGSRNVIWVTNLRISNAQTFPRGDPQLALWKEIVRPRFLILYSVPNETRRHNGRSLSLIYPDSCVCRKRNAERCLADRLQPALSALFEQKEQLCGNKGVSDRKAIKLVHLLKQRRSVSEAVEPLPHRKPAT